MSDKSQQFTSPRFDKRSSRTKNGLHNVHEDDDKILDEQDDESLQTSKTIESLGSQKHGNYFSAHTTNTTRSGNQYGAGMGNDEGMSSVINKKADELDDDDQQNGDESSDDGNDASYNSKGIRIPKPKDGKVKKITQSKIQKDRPSTLKKQTNQGSSGSGS